MHTYDSINQAKKQSLEIANIYSWWAKESGSEAIAARAARVAGCSQVWQGFRCPDCGQLHGMVSYGCHDRLCPICAAKLARATAAQALQAMAVMQTDKTMQACGWGLLTLTIRNVPGAELANAIDAMLHHWSLLRRLRPVARVLVGWARNIEITYNASARTFHPHIHCIVAVSEPALCVASQTHPEPGSGVPTYPATQWAAWWRQAAGLSYMPVCDIRPLQNLDAVFEVSKYVTKPGSLFDRGLSFAVRKRVVRTIAEAIFNRRLRSYGGAWLRARRALHMVAAEDLSDAELDSVSATLESGCQCGSTQPAVPIVLQWAGLKYSVHEVPLVELDE